MKFLQRMVDKSVKNILNIPERELIVINFCYYD